MKAGAEGAGVDQSQYVGSDFRRTDDGNDTDATHLYRPWMEDPHRTGVASDRVRHRHGSQAQRPRELRRRETVRHQRCDGSVWQPLGIERAKLHESIEDVVRMVADVYAVRHGGVRP